MATTLFYLPHIPHAQRLRLALGAKRLNPALRRLDWFDDETFFELGIARQPCVLQTPDGRVHTDSAEVLAAIDDLFPDSPPLREGLITEAAWAALLDWRQWVDTILERLYAPLAPGFHGIGDQPDAMADFRAWTRHRLGAGLEELANDRYAGYARFARLSRLSELARHLARERFYLGRLSVADCLLAADLYPLQMHDGIHLPINLLYYLNRVEEACGVRLDHDRIAA
nr:glutathione S-transferase N-terminal domain-containing protein [Thioalkalivibrio nitratireducens]